jgi:predicted sulfurtransferase
MPYHVAAFYQFAALPDFRELREPLRAICAGLELKGSVLLATEGINGTLPFSWRAARTPSAAWSANSARRPCSAAGSTILN